jgi:hypothetical protein
MPWFLDTYLEGASEEAFFHRFGMDPIRWTFHLVPDEERGEYWVVGEERRPLMVSDDWQVERSPVSASPSVTRFTITTPGGTLSMALEEGPQTDWVVERPIKQKDQIELFHRYAPRGRCDVAAIREEARHVEEGGWGILRGAIPGFQIYGQPGCWQDAVELFGLQELILETMDDAEWVRSFLDILRERKKGFIATMEGAPYDLLELGGGSASSTVISPGIFQDFVAPYDSDLIEELHRMGQRVVYHTCGGMMPLLEMIAEMGPDAMETFTPPALGGDADLARAKARIGDRVCMIGGFDQHTYFRGCSPDETRAAVRRAFQEAGGGGGFILAPSDHFFDADVELLEAFSHEARRCLYS